MAPKTILIADDDSDLIDVLARRCRQLGLSVFVAYDGLTALTLIDQQSPDLVCLDVNMPLGNGLGVCEMLAPDEALSSIPVIVLTGRSDEETIRRCQAMGAHYVFKSRDVWQCLQPVLWKLLDIVPPECNAPEASRQSDWERLPSPPSGRGLSHLIEALARSNSTRS